MNDLVRILSSSVIDVNRIAGLLDENNIPSLIRNNVESARIAGFGVPENSVELYVNKSDLEEAQKIIEDYNRKNPPV